MCMSKHRQRGISLIELIIFIVIVSVALAGVLLVLSTAVKGSADPINRKQALAIAESLLTEIEQQPFTYCDLQDANVETATSTTACALASNAQDNGGASLGPVPNTETRYSASNPFDNVADYAGFSENNIRDITQSYAMTGYNASVAITRVGNAAPFAVITDPSAVLKISVTVTSGNESVTLTGYRFRYAPNI